MDDEPNYRLLAALEKLKAHDYRRRFSQAGRPDNVQSWSAQHVAGWLTENGHAVYAHTFQDAAINGLALTALTSIDLEQVGVVDVTEQAAILRLVTPLREASGMMAAPSLDGSDVNAASWDPWHVRDWLVRSGLDEHVRPFDRSAVNGQALLEMTEQELRLMGIHDPSDHAAIMAAVRQLRAATRDRGRGRPTAGTGRSGLSTGARSHSTSFHESQRRSESGPATPSRLQHTHKAASVSSTASQSGGSEVGFASAGGAGTSNGSNRFALASPPSHVPAQWTIADVGDWLVHSKFGYLAQSFCDAGIDGNRLLRLTPRDLPQLGVLRPATQQAVMDAIGELRQQQAAMLAQYDARALRMSEGLAEDVAARLRLDRYDSAGNERTMEASRAASTMDQSAMTDSSVGADESMMFTNHPFSVEVTKSNGSFGFSIVGGAAHELPPTVSEVREDGPAAGRLQKGDRVLTVNRRDLADGTHSEIIALIRRSGDTLLLSILRPSEPPKGLSRAPSRMSLRSTHSHSSLQDGNDVRNWMSRSRTSLNDFPASPLAAKNRPTSPRQQPQPQQQQQRPSYGGDSGSVSSLGPQSPPPHERPRRRTEPRTVPDTPPTAADVAKARANGGNPDVGGGLGVLQQMPFHRSATLLVPVLSWDVGQTEQWIAEQGYPQLRKAIRGRRIDGPALLLLTEGDVQQLVRGEPECRGVWPLIRELQDDSPPVPAAVKWSIADVGLWLEHNGLGDLRKPFAKRRISGRELLCPAAGDDALTTLERQQTGAALQELKAADPSTHVGRGRVMSWSVPEVCDWLHQQGASSARTSFSKNKVDGQALLGLSHDALFRMGVRQTDLQTSILNGISSIAETEAPSDKNNAGERGGEGDGGDGPQTWGVNEVLDWLAHMGFGDVCQTFLADDIVGVPLRRCL